MVVIIIIVIITTITITITIIVVVVVTIVLIVVFVAGLQINCDGEPMRDTHFSFKVLPHRLRLHMPQPKLLRQPSRVLNPAQQEYREKINSKLVRPERKPKATLWRHPVVQSVLRNGLLLGAGVALTLGVQRMQQHRLRREI